MKRTARRNGSARMLAIAMVVGLLVVGSATVGAAFEIPMGTATVDGDLSEWAGANWIDMDQIYHDDPVDLSGAKWAARWSSDTLYVAVTGVDSDHVLTSSNEGWDQQDAVEIYVDPANKNNEAYNDTFADAQQFVGGTDGTADGEWLTLGGADLPDGAVQAFKAGVDGDVLNYEIALKPYDSLNTDDVPASSVLTLSAGMTVGLDVVMNSKHADGFGMLCENTNGGKWGNAVQFIDHVLIPEPASIVLLAIGALCMLASARRRTSTR